MEQKMGLLISRMIDQINVYTQIHHDIWYMMMHGNCYLMHCIQQTTEQASDKTGRIDTCATVQTFTLLHRKDGPDRMIEL